MGKPGPPPPSSPSTKDMNHVPAGQASDKGQIPDTSGLSDAEPAPHEALNTVEQISVPVITTFPITKLPTEIQITIWQHALPGRRFLPIRFLPIDMTDVRRLVKPTYCFRDPPSPPNLTQTCKLSREVAMKSGMFLSSFDGPMGIWFNPELDVLVIKYGYKNLGPADYTRKWWKNLGRVKRVAIDFSRYYYTSFMQQASLKKAFKHFPCLQEVSIILSDQDIEDQGYSYIMSDQFKRYDLIHRSNSGRPNESEWYWSNDFVSDPIVARQEQLLAYTKETGESWTPVPLQFHCYKLPEFLVQGYMGVQDVTLELTGSCETFAGNSGAYIRTISQSDGNRADVWGRLSG